MSRAALSPGIPEAASTPVRAATDTNSRTSGARILPFLLQVTAAAALVLFLASIAVKFQGNPEGEALQADTTNMTEVFDNLDRLNRAEEARLEEEARAGSLNSQNNGGSK